MKNRTLTINCDAKTAHNLGQAIHAYAHAAYPDGGSECAQVARQTLLETAALCESHADGRLVLRRRQLPLLRAAVRWFFSTEGPGDVESRPAVETLLATDKESA